MFSYNGSLVLLCVSEMHTKRVWLAGFGASCASGVTSLTVCLTRSIDHALSGSPAGGTGGVAVASGLSALALLRLPLA